MSRKSTILNWQLYLGFVLVVAGGLFLADQILDLQLMRTYWPLLIALSGIIFFVAMISARKKGAWLSIPGAILGTVGVLLYIQHTYRLWATWTYAWGLLISATGMGLLIMNIYMKRVNLCRVAGLLIGIGLILFLIFGLFFEIILSISGPGAAGRIFFGAGVILLGVFVLFSKPIFSRRSVMKTSESPSQSVTLDADFEDMPLASAPSDQEIHALPENAEFSDLYIKSTAEVVITQGESCSLQMKGDQDFFKRHKITVMENILSIVYDSVSIGGTMEKNQFLVTVRDLEQVSLAGAGLINANGLVGEKLKVEQSGMGKIKLEGLQYTGLQVTLDGSGEIQLEGVVDSQDISLNGAGRYQADHLKSRQANILLTGAGLIKIWAEETMSIDAPGPGEIIYKGSPELTVSEASISNIKAMD